MSGAATVGATRRSATVSDAAEVLAAKVTLVRIFQLRHLANVADEALLARDPLAFIYIATVLARPVNNANRALIELKRQLHAREPHSVIVETIAEIDASLVYAGYPLNPFSRH